MSTHRCRGGAARAWAWMLLLAAAGGCRLEACAPGLGHGTDPATLPKAAPILEATALRSLATVQGGPFRNHPTTVPVVGETKDRLLLLVPEAGGDSRVEQARVTFRDPSGRVETVGDVRLEFARQGAVTAGVFSAPRPRFKVPVATLATEEVAAAEFGQQRFVLGDAKGSMLVRTLDEVVQRKGYSQEEAHRQGADPGGVLLDPLTGHVTALRLPGRYIERPEDQGSFLATPKLRQALAGRLRWGLIGAEEGCKVSVRLRLDDPLRTIPEVVLLASKPGRAVELPTPALVEEGRPGAPEPTAGSALAGGVGKVVARARPDGSGEVVLQAELSDCAERYAQVVLLGERTRWLSWPYRIPAPSARPRAVSPSREAWRIDQIPSTEPLQWPLISAGDLARSEAPEGCMPPGERFEAEGIYVVERREQPPDPRCAGGQLVAPGAGPGDGRCLGGTASPLVIRPDGTVVYVEHDAKVPLARQLLPDRMEREPGGACRPVAAQANDELVAVAPCVRRPWGSPERIAATLAEPDGSLVFACSDGWVREDGTSLDLHGATSLLRLGDDGRKLVRLPWGSLGVLGPDGRGVEVHGLPARSEVDRNLASAATPDGFLVALWHTRGAEAAGPKVFELFAISAEGVASSRGQLEPPAGFGVMLLDPEGGLWTFKAGPSGHVWRTVPGSPPEPRGGVLARLGADGKPEERTYPGPLTFLAGWRSAGPASPVAVSVKHDASAEAARAYRAMPAAALPCAGTLEAIDPGRVYAVIGGTILDPALPERTAYAAAAEPRLLPDGRVAATARAPGDQEDAVYLVPLDGHAHRPQGNTCQAVTALARPLAPVEGGRCGAGSFHGFAARPDATAPAIVCRGREDGPAIWMDGRAVPGYGLQAAGHDRRLLLQEREGWVMVDPAGRRTPLQAPWTKVRAIRATRTGFGVAAERTTPKGTMLELYQVGDDGRVRRAGGFDLVADDRDILDLVLGPDLALWVSARRQGAATIERLPVGAREPEVVWNGGVGGGYAKLLTGP